MASGSGYETLDADATASASDPSITLRHTDLAVAAALGLAAFIAYAALALRLAKGPYLEYYNLAFDFDPVRVLSLLTASPPDAFGFKHPLMLLLRPLGQALLAFGIPAKPAAGLVVAATGAASVGVVFLFLRTATIRRPEAAALAALFAVTSTQLTVSIVTETYSFASLSLILVWSIAQSRIAQVRLRRPDRFRRARYAVAVMVAGVTITNAVQPVAAELLVAWRRYGLRDAIPRVILFCVVCGLLFGAAALVLWPAEIWHAVRAPVHALKTIWWLQTKGPVTGIGKVLETFLGFSFVSPDYTVVPLPDGTRMVDFRAWSIAGHGGLVAAGWLAFLAAGAAAALTHRTYRVTAWAIGATLLFNILFHLGFQYRFSLYLYTAHTNFLVFALSAGIAPWVAGRPRARLAYTAAVLLVAAAVASVNVPIAMNFATRFDVPDTVCPAPCADTLP